MINEQGHYVPYTPAQDHYYRSWGGAHLWLDQGSIFTDLYRDFNMVTIPLQTMEAFHYDVQEIAQQSPTVKAFRASLNERKLLRLAQLMKILDCFTSEFCWSDHLCTACDLASREAFLEMSCDAILRFVYCLVPETPKTFKPATEEDPNDDPYYVPPSPSIHREACQAYYEEDMKNVTEENFVDSPPGLRYDYAWASRHNKITDTNDNDKDNDSENGDSNQSPNLIENASASPSAKPSASNKNSKQNSHGIISPLHPLPRGDNDPQPKSQHSSSLCKTSESTESYCNDQNFRQNTPSRELVGESYSEQPEHTNDVPSDFGDSGAFQDDEGVTISFEDVPRTASQLPVEAVSSVDDAIVCYGATSGNTPEAATSPNSSVPISAKGDEYTSVTNIASSEQAGFLLDQEASPACPEYSGDVDMDDTSLLLDDASLNAINSALHQKHKTKMKTKSAGKRRRSPSPLASSSHAPKKVSKKHQCPKA